MSAGPSTPGDSGFTISNVQTITAGALVGFFDVTIPNGICLHRCCLFRKDGRTWASPPSKPVIARDGAVQRNPAGKTLYEPAVSFRDRAASDAWNASVMAAMRGTELDAGA